MTLKDFLATWRGTSLENRYNRLVIGGLVAANLMLCFYALTNRTVVALVPPNLENVSQLERNAAGESYKTAWAYFMASMMGSVTPVNADFVVNRMGQYLDSSVYKSISEDVAKQATAIKMEGLSIIFTPRSVVYEAETDKVFVTGYTRTIGRDNRVEQVERTYEFIITIRNYQPVVTYFTVYRGFPRTLSRQNNPQPDQPTPMFDLDQAPAPSAEPSAEQPQAVEAATPTAEAMPSPAGEEAAQQPQVEQQYEPTTQTQ